MKAWKILTTFLLPVCTLLFAMAAAGIMLGSQASVVVLVVFMTMKVVLEYFCIEPASVAFVRAGRETEFRAYSGLIFSALGLGTLLLFMLATR